MFITKKLQQAVNKKEKDEILAALKNSSIVAWSHINLFGIYDFQNYSKRIHRLITLDESKGFINVKVSENNFVACREDMNVF